MKFAHIREANISHLRSKYFTAKLFHMAKPYFTRRRRISLKKAHICLLDKCVLFSGGGCGIRTHVRLLSNGFQDFLTNPTLTKNNRKYQTVENAENPDVARAFGVLSFLKPKTSSAARISASKTISKDFLEKVLDKSALIRPVASHII